MPFRPIIYRIRTDVSWGEVVQNSLEESKYLNGVLRKGRGGGKEGVEREDGGEEMEGEIESRTGEESRKLRKRERRGLEGGECVGRELPFLHLLIYCYY